MIFWNNVISNNFWRKKFWHWPKYFHVVHNFADGCLCEINQVANSVAILKLVELFYCDFLPIWDVIYDLREEPLSPQLSFGFYRHIIDNQVEVPDYLNLWKKKQRKRWSKVEQRRAKRDHRWKSGNIEIGKGSTKYNFNFKDVVFLQLQSNR